MAKLTLEQTWRKCLQMWKWVAKNAEAEPHNHEAKKHWMKLHKVKRLENCCYFCDYAQQQFTDGHHIPHNAIDYYCGCCPGRLVNRKFTCEGKAYNWLGPPQVFYQRLVELNEKRKQQRLMEGGK